VVVSCLARDRGTQVTAGLFIWVVAPRPEGALE